MKKQNTDGSSAPHAEAEAAPGVQQSAGRVPARAETGVMLFEDDWPGIFIRGDNAMAMALRLEQIGLVAEIMGTQLRAAATSTGKPHTDLHPLHLRWIANTVALLRSCDARCDPPCQRARLLLPDADDSLTAGHPTPSQSQDDGPKSVPKKGRL